MPFATFYEFLTIIAQFHKRFDTDPLLHLFVYVNFDRLKMSCKEKCAHKIVLSQAIWLVLEANRAERVKGGHLLPFLAHSAQTFGADLEHIAEPPTDQEKVRTLH